MNNLLRITLPAILFISLTGCLPHSSSQPDPGIISQPDSDISDGVGEIENNNPQPSAESSQTESSVDPTTPMQIAVRPTPPLTIYQPYPTNECDRVAALAQNQNVSLHPKLITTEFDAQEFPVG